MFGRLSASDDAGRPGWLKGRHGVSLATCRGQTDGVCASMGIHLVGRKRGFRVYAEWGVR